MKVLKIVGIVFLLLAAAAFPYLLKEYGMNDYRMTDQEIIDFALECDRQGGESHYKFDSNYNVFGAVCNKERGIK